MTLDKPTILAVSLADGLQWPADGAHIYQEKADGCWSPETANVNGCEIVAEWIPKEKRQRSAGALWIAHDIVSVDGQDISTQMTKTRWQLLTEFAGPLPEGMRLCRFGAGGAFLQSELDRGGEGVVRKPACAPYGIGWQKCKRCEVFYLIVTKLHYDKDSVDTVDRGLLIPRGRVMLRNRFQKVRVGSVIKVEALGAHPSGLLREAKPDTDSETSWLVKF